RARGPDAVRVRAGLRGGYFFPRGHEPVGGAGGARAEAVSELAGDPGASGGDAGGGVQAGAAFASAVVAGGVPDRGDRSHGVRAVGEARDRAPAARGGAAAADD